MCDQRLALILCNHFFSLSAFVLFAFIQNVHHAPQLILSQNQVEGIQAPITSCNLQLLSYMHCGAQLVCATFASN